MATKEPDHRGLYEEALRLLREAPTRHAMDRCCDKSPTHRYWPWRRRVEDFLEKVDLSS